MLTLNFKHIVCMTNGEFNIFYNEGNDSDNEFINYNFKRLQFDDFKHFCLDSDIKLEKVYINPPITPFPRIILKFKKTGDKRNERYPIAYIPRESNSGIFDGYHKHGFSVVDATINSYDDGSLVITGIVIFLESFIELGRKYNSSPIYDVADSELKLYAAAANQLNWYSSMYYHGEWNWFLASDKYIGRLYYKDSEKEKKTKENKEFDSMNIKHFDYTNERIFNQYHINDVLNSFRVDCEIEQYKLHHCRFKIKDIKFSGNKTIVFWKDNTKTIVTNHEEEFDVEKAIAFAYMKKALSLQFGTSKERSINDIIKKYTDKYEEIKEENERHIKELDQRSYRQINNRMKEGLLTDYDEED